MVSRGRVGEKLQRRRSDFLENRGLPACEITTRILFLNLFATSAQWNHLAVLSHSFDGGSATLIWRSPIGGKFFGAGDSG